MRLLVRYARPEDFIGEYDQQMTRGGLLVRGDPPAGLALYDRVELEIGGDFAALGTPQVLEGQVVQAFAGVGVAVAFDPAPLAAAIAAARGNAPKNEPDEEPEAARVRAAAQKGDTAAKIQQALHGTKDDRMRTLRDSNRMLHPYVLKNPGLGLDEVLAMAKMSTLSPEIYASIAERREWASRPDIAVALVRNPKTPAPVAVRLLEFVSATDLRQLAKDNHTRPQVQQAARKRVLG